MTLVDRIVATHRPTMTQGKCRCGWQGVGDFALGRHLVEAGVVAAQVVTERALP